MRHELSLVDIDYRDEVDESNKAKTKPALTPTVVVHYINPEVETDPDLVSFANPGPLVRLIHREISEQPAPQGVSAQFCSEAEIAAELASAPSAQPGEPMLAAAPAEMTDDEVSAFLNLDGLE